MFYLISLFINNYRLTVDYFTSQTLYIHFLGDNFLLYRAISQGSSTEMAANVEKYLKMGYRKFQLKVGGNVSDDIARIRTVRELLDIKTLELRESSKAKIRLGGLKEGEYDESNLSIPLLCDANTGWLQHEAIQVGKFFEECSLKRSYL